MFIDLNLIVVVEVFGDFWLEVDEVVVEFGIGNSLEFINLDLIIDRLCGLLFF